VVRYKYLFFHAGVTAKKKKDVFIMSEFSGSLGKKAIWHIAKIPIIVLVLFLLVMAGPLPYAQGGTIGCTCPDCAFYDWYVGIGVFERLWYNLKVIMQSYLS